MKFIFGLRTLVATLMIGLGLTSAAVAQDFAYVANTLSDNVSVLDLSTNTVSGSAIAVGTVPLDIAVSPNGSQLAVVNSTGGSVSLIDVATNTVSSTIATGGVPNSVTYAPDGNSIYVSFISQNLVRNYDLAGNTLASISISVGPSALEVRPGTNELLVVLSGDGALGKIDITTNTVIAGKIVLEGLSGGNSTNPFAIAVSANGNTALVPNSSSFYTNIVDLTTGTVSRVQEFGFDAFMSGSIDAAIVGTTGYVTEESSGELNIINLTNGSITSTISFGFTSQPIGVAISPDGTKAIVALSATNEVAIVDLATGNFTTVAVGTTPRAVLAVSPAANPCPATPVVTNICASIEQGSSFSFDGQNLTAAGTYTDTVVTALGCDSIINLTLVVRPAANAAAVTALQAVLDQNLQSSGGLSGAFLDVDGSIAPFGNGFSGVGVATNSTLKYGLSDVSQLVMAVLTLKLVEDGVISLTDQIGANLVPGLPPFVLPATTTIEQLLAHTSGINNFATFATYKDPGLSLLFNNLTQDWSAINYQPILASYVSPQGPAGTAGTFAYSNTNFLALGEKLEQVTGQSLADLLNQNVFIPAGLSETQLEGTPAASNASAFYFNLSGILPEALASQVSVLTSSGGSAGIVATPTDVMKFVTALFDGKIISTASLSTLQNFSTVTGRCGNAYGLGIERFDIDINGTTETFVGHTGDVNYTTALFYSSTLNAGVFLSANLDDVADTTVKRIAEELLNAGLNPDPCANVTPTVTNTSAAICDGDSFSFGGQSLTVAGSYADTARSVAGCDSAITNLTLTVNAGDSTTVQATTCDASQVGSTFQTLTNQFGCDSIIETVTTLLRSDSVTIQATTCDPNLAGVNSITLTNAVGCDSVVTTVTTAFPSDTTVFDLTTCDPSLVGSDTAFLNNQFGCDSLVITNTTIGGSITVLANATSCDPAAVGVDTTIIPGTAGCDTVLITTTTLLASSATTVQAASCNPADTGTSVVTLTNAAGCDSVVTTVTTLLPSSATTVQAASCNPADTGTSVVTLTNVAGCDSVVTTITTLLPSDSTTVQATTTDPAQVGSSSVTLTNQFGCDSVVTTITTLAAPNTVFFTINANICPGETFDFGGQSIGVGGTYVDTLMASSGADSIVTLNLTVLPAPAPVVVSAVQTVLDNNLQSAGGLSAAVLNADMSITTATNGFAAVGTPNDPSFMYGLSDVSQHIVAVLTLALMEDGVLSLNDQIGTVPGLNTAKVPATTTIAQLLGHTSGADNFADNPTYKDAGLSPLFADLTFDFGTVNFAPIQALAGNAGAAGSFDYANTNYLALGLALENITGKSLQTLISDYIVTPAGLGNIKDFAAPGPMKPASYVFNLSGILPEFLVDQTSVLSSGGASGNLIATPTTMAKYLKALFAGNIIDATSLTQLTAFAPVTGRLSEEYAFGTEKFTLDIDGQMETVVGHYGDLNYTSILLYVPGSSTGVFVSSNNDEVSDSTILEIARQLLEASVNPTPDPCPVIPVTSAFSATITDGETFQLGTQSLTVAGVYSETFTTAEGCDSVVTLTLSVNALADTAVSNGVQRILAANVQSAGGLTAAVLCPDGAIATASNGFAQVSVPSTDDFKYGLSDVSQHMMAVLTLSLVENGLVSLSDTLGTVMNGIPSSILPAGTTIKQLLSHESGINNFGTFPTYKDPAVSVLFNDLTFNWFNTDLSPIVANFVNPQGVAGAAGSFDYANTNYLVLGRRLEQLTGMSLQDLLDTYVLTPAGLNGSDIAFSPTAGPTSSYVFNLSGILPEFLFDQTSVLTSSGASASMVATPSAMATYLKALFGGDILSSASLTSLTDFQPITGRLSDAYGLGTEEFTLDINGQPTTFIGHYGDLNYTSVLLYSTDLNSGVFVASNFDDVTDSTILEIARQLIEGTKVDTTTSGVCPAFAGTVSADQDTAFIDSVSGRAFAAFTPNGDAVIPAGYAQSYLLTAGSNLTLKQVSPVGNPFQLRRAGEFNVHSFVYDPDPTSPDYVDIDAVRGLANTPAGNIVASLVSAGICFDLDVVGTTLIVAEQAAGVVTPPDTTITPPDTTITPPDTTITPPDTTCLADAGTVSTTQDTFFIQKSSGRAFLAFTPNGDAVIPAGYAQAYLLTAGNNLTLKQVSPVGNPFQLRRAGEFKVHSFVYDPDPNSPDYIDINAVRALANTPAGTIVANLNAAGICFDLDVVGTTAFIAEMPANRLSDFANSIVISPNPAILKVFVTVESASVVEYELADAAGKRVAKGQFDFAVNANGQLDLSNVAQGVYQLSLRNVETGEVHIEKIIKQ